MDDLVIATAQSLALYGFVGKMTNNKQMDIGCLYDPELLKELIDYVNSPEYQRIAVEEYRRIERCATESDD